MTQPIITRVQALANGDRFYYTGVPCKYGHIAKRYVGHKQCVECNKMHQRAHGQKHRKELTEKHRKYVEAHAEEVREYQKEYHRQRRLNDPEKVRENNRLYNIRYRERQRAAKKEQADD